MASLAKNDGFPQIATLSNNNKIYFASRHRRIYKLEKTSGPLKPMGEKVSKRQPSKQFTGKYQDHLSVAVMPQDGHLDPSRTMEVSRPKQAHTQHFTLKCSVISVSFTNFFGKIRLPVVLPVGDPGGVKLGELAGITESGGKASHW